jgi:hypothetical protein
MHIIERMEARILDTNNVLLVLSPLDDDRLLRDFCGAVIRVDKSAPSLPELSRKTVYLCGDLSLTSDLNLKAAQRIFVVEELSHGRSEGSSGWSLVNLGRLPILVHGVGVYYRRFFEPGFDYFTRICQEHTFQSLTESNKPGKAHRTGIYLTPVEPDGDDLHFRLLRCSTNLSGPTENFRANDRHIVDALNQEAPFIFQNQAPLNHVLAQIYNNTPAAVEQKQTKATISAHADKTKDMPGNGIMVFCTFYNQLDKLHPLSADAFDYGYKETSGLTRLRFRLKEPDTELAGIPLPQQFTVTLYPNSAFFMPLSTNRFYTHEIQPSALDAARLPTRLGYVVRCSNAEAVYKDGNAFLKKGETLVRLEPPTEEGIIDLRRLYAKENKTQSFVDYGDRFYFSMNEGDYLAPEYKAVDEFRSYNLITAGNLFEELLASAQFEAVGKGRQGAVLVKNDDTGIPIVRTTTKYGVPVQRFQSIHDQLAKQIQERASLSVSFNNALIENYTNAYTTMGSHSDQALDLADESFIAIFSCYRNPELPYRKLVVESKEPGGDAFEIPLAHSSVVVFSVDTNRRFKHKIVLDTPTSTPENQWLGITFRTSKTLVQFRGEHAYFLDGTRLSLANDEEGRQFYQLRSRENNEVDFAYPRVTYTVNAGDMMPPDALAEVKAHTEDVAADTQT